MRVLHKYSAVLGTVGLLIISAVFLYQCVPASKTETVAQQNNRWSQTHSVGELTQELSYFAVSPRVSPRFAMAFPYNEVTASLGFGCNRTEQWLYIAFSEPPNFANARSGEKSNQLQSSIRFDDDVADYDLTQVFGARFVHFKDDPLVLERILGSSSMSFTVEWHEEGNIHFNFPLAGSAQAIASTQQKCAE